MSILNRMNLGTMVLAAVSATAIVSAASAQTTRHPHPRAHHAATAVMQPQTTPVYRGTGVIGADPDPNVRLELQRSN